MKTLPTSSRYTTAFWDYIKRRNTDNRADLSERKTYDGGVVVPSDDETILSAELAKRNVFRQICSVVATNSPGTMVRALSPAGEAAFVPEDGVIPSSDAVQTEFKIRSYKIAQLIRVGYDLLNDAGYDLRSALMKELGRMFASAEENACVNGDGETQPCGILHAEHGAETGASVTGSSITFDDVAALYFSVGSEYRQCGTWLMNDQTAFALRRLKDSTGNPIWPHSCDTLFGKPVFISRFMPDIAPGNKPIAFGDFNFYWLFERGSALIKSLKEMYAVQEQAGFICSKHIDGRLVRQEAIKVLEMAQEA